VEPRVGYTQQQPQSPREGRAHVLASGAALCSVGSPPHPGASPSSQVLCDVLQTDGRLGHPAGGGTQAVKLYVCNFDFTFAWADVAPRFGPGAFVRCLETLFLGVTGRPLTVCLSLRSAEPEKNHGRLCES
jgi:hypothetical protein